MHSQTTKHLSGIMITPEEVAAGHAARELYLLKRSEEARVREIERIKDAVKEISEHLRQPSLLSRNNFGHHTYFVEIAETSLAACAGFEACTSGHVFYVGIAEKGLAADMSAVAEEFEVLGFRTQMVYDHPRYEDCGFLLWAPLPK